jgi:protein SCO1
MVQPSPLGFLRKSAAVLTPRIKAFKLFVIATNITILATACGFVDPGNTGIIVTQLPSGGMVINKTTPVKDAVMIDQNGKQVHLNDLHGKYTLLFFGYTNCPDACPVTLSNFTRIRRLLASDTGDNASKVNFVFISIDPNRDTPTAIKMYLSGFDPEFIGLTADIPTLQAVADDFGAVFDIAATIATPDPLATDPANPIGTTVGHSTRSYLIDPEGRIKITYPLESLPDPIAIDLRSFLTGK